jgi:hypothetical protein
VGDVGEPVSNSDDGRSGQLVQQNPYSDMIFKTSRNVVITIRTLRMKTEHELGFWR